MLVNLESHGTRSVEIKGHFAFVHFTGNQFPAFFWKLHVSLPPRDYERHIQSIVDFLVMRKSRISKLPDMTFPQILFNSNWKSCIQYLTFKREASSLWWNDTAEHPVYGDDVNSLFDVIELFISTERRKNRRTEKRTGKRNQQSHHGG